MKSTKEELIKHCERQIQRNTGLYSSNFSKKIIFEHKVFLELLKGKSINEIFDEKGEYINDEN